MAINGNPRGQSCCANRSASGHRPSHRLRVAGLQGSSPPGHQPSPTSTGPARGFSPLCNQASGSGGLTPTPLKPQRTPPLAKMGPK